jgi:tRNA U34 5-methylaminomethyl-2-thiouridine-forming methyltransferase MnmC
MKDTHRGKIVNSFQLSNLGIIIFIKNENDGLKKGTLLKSLESNRLWIVKSRIIEFPTIEIQFEKETVINSLLQFSNIENKLKAEEKAKEGIKDNVYQYLIEPIFHKNKPLENEIVEVKELLEKSINLKILKTLIRELKFHSNNGEQNINSIGFISFEVSKMTKSKSRDVLEHLIYLIDEDFIKIISDEPLVYKLTEKEKHLK